VRHRLVDSSSLRIPQKRLLHIEDGGVDDLVAQKQRSRLLLVLCRCLLLLRGVLLLGFNCKAASLLGEVIDRLEP